MSIPDSRVFQKTSGDQQGFAISNQEKTYENNFCGSKNLESIYGYEVLCQSVSK